MCTCEMADRLTSFANMYVGTVWVPSRAVGSPGSWTSAARNHLFAASCLKPHVWMEAGTHMHACICRLPLLPGRTRPLSTENCMPGPSTRPPTFCLPSPHGRGSSMDGTLALCIRGGVFPLHLRSTGVSIRSRRRQGLCEKKNKKNKKQHVTSHLARDERETSPRLASPLPSSPCTAAPCHPVDEQGWVKAGKG